LKELVEIRPIFYYKDRRVKTHIFLCILAQSVVNRIRDVLKAEGKGRTISSLLDALETINMELFEMDKGKAEIITALTDEQKEISDTFDMDQKIFTDFDKAKAAVA